MDSETGDKESSSYPLRSTNSSHSHRHRSFMMDPEAQANSETAANDNPSPDEPARLPDDTKDETTSGVQPEANGEDGVGQQSPETDDDTTAKRNINSYYGHKIGAIQTLSLVLNAGLMVYAHLGLSAVIKSSLDPERETSLLVVEGETCSNVDDSTWTSYEGEIGFPDQLDFCARTYIGGCLVNGTCTSECFEKNYGYSSKCSLCFGNFPPCGEPVAPDNISCNESSTVPLTIQ